MATANNCCKSLDDLQACLTSGDVSAIPTAQVNLRNIELPLSKDDAEFLAGTDATGAQTGVDFYANPSGQPQRDMYGNLSISQPQGMVRSGLRFRTHFVLDSICVIAHCEPYSWTLDGNQFGPQNVFDTTEKKTPVSADRRIDNQVIDGIEAIDAEHTSVCNAQLEWGGPTWRAAHFFLQTYRLALQCPSAANVYELMNERLVDLGNCCMGTNYNGFGLSTASEIYGVRRVNKRLKWLTSNGQVPMIDGIDGIEGNSEDLGYFLPFNTTNESFSGGKAIENIVREPQRMFGAPSAYGSPIASPHMYRWYRLPVPRVISPDENLEILLKRENSDNGFYQRMLQEMAFQPCLSPIPGVTGQTTDITLTDGTYTSLVDTQYVRIPGGQMRIGVALKGMMIDHSLCCAIKERFNALSVRDVYASGMRAGGFVEGAVGSTLSSVLGGCGCSR